jgi:sulfate adenylyltransferase
MSKQPPHGGTLVTRLATGAQAAKLRDLAKSLPRFDLSSKQACDLEMIAIGAFSPLQTFMGAADVGPVASRMSLASGLLWPIPILLSTPKAKAPKVGQQLALHAPGGGAGGGLLQAVINVTEVFPHDKSYVKPVFGTDDPAHPGVKAVMDEGDTCFTGELWALETCPDPAGPEAFLDHRLTPAQTRAQFQSRGWSTVCAFQTRNPIHRAHEYLCKVAQEIVDGLLIHPLVGETKPGDVPAAVRMECYKVLIDKYFVPARTMLSVMPAAMRYAGPREAVLHAIVRKNYGCTHFIVGRDHAGVGNYYGTYDAQNMFTDDLVASLGLTIFKFEHTAYSRAAGGLVSPKTFPKIEGDQINLSGTQVRDMLASGQRPPAEFSRPEVADVLIRWTKNAKP